MLNTLTTHSEKVFPLMPFNRFFTGLYYNRIIKKECTLANVKAHEKVLFIGGGAYPYSALYIHKLTKAKVDVLDYDNGALIRAKKHLKQKEKENISFYHGNGLTFNVTEYDVIFLAKQILQKSEVIEHVSNAMKDKARLLVRCDQPTCQGCPVKKVPVKYAFIKELRLYA